MKTTTTTNHIRISRDHHQNGDAVAIADPRGQYIIDGYGEYEQGAEVRCWPNGRTTDLREVDSKMRTKDRYPLNGKSFVAPTAKKQAGKIVSVRGNSVVTEG